MRILIILNALAGVLQAAAFVLSIKWETPIVGLIAMGLFFGFLALAAANVLCIFLLWKRHRLRAFIPLGTFVFVSALSLIGARFGAEFVLRETPCRPKSFLKGPVKEDLTRTAERLLGNGYKTIWIGSAAAPELRTIAGLPPREIAPEILATLRKHGFQHAFIDDRQLIVTFGFRKNRTWFNYTWARDGLSKLSSTPPTITEVDVEKWEELMRIAKQGDVATEGERNRIEFEPCIAYPLLQRALGPATLDRFKQYRSANEFTEDDRKLVLAALNHIVLPANALVENPHITYRTWRWNLFAFRGLCFAKMQVNDGFEEVKLAQELLASGVIRLAADGAHLELKPSLNDQERARVQWLHIGLLRFIFGNLVYKRQHSFEEDLGDHWYFSQSRH